MDGLKRGRAAIVGVAESDLGQVADGFSDIDLMAQGTTRALDDCGLSLKDVDGLFSATAQSRLSVGPLSRDVAGLRQRDGPALVRACRGVFAGSCCGPVVARRHVGKAVDLLARWPSTRAMNVTLQGGDFR